MDAGQLYEAVLVVCPITGAKVGDQTDRSTWSVDFDPAATAQQRTDAQNVIDTFVAPPAQGPWFNILANDLTMSSNVLADVPGMSIQLWPNREYLFEGHLWFRTAATTTGILFSATGPTSPVGFDMTVETALTATSMNTQRITAYDGGIPTGSIDVAATDRLAKITGYIQTGAASGQLKLRWRSEVNLSQVTLRKGSRASVWIP
jgi:hypothetical protein